MSSVVPFNTPAPRVTSVDLLANIVDTEIVKHVTKSGKILRWAVCTTRNGFAVVGKPSAAVSVENDNRHIGESIAIENTHHELWQLMGYALATKLHEQDREGKVPKNSAE